MANEKLIDANWIFGEIEHDLGCYEIGKLGENESLYVDLKDVVRMIGAAPAVDAVEVVRCKDCKLWLGDGYLSIGRCNKWSAPVASITPFTRADDFCSYGERREGE